MSGSSWVCLRDAFMGKMTVYYTTYTTTKATIAKDGH
jgi:hypothetical protein